MNKTQSWGDYVHLEYKKTKMTAIDMEYNRGYSGIYEGAPVSLELDNRSQAHTLSCHNYNDF